MLRIMKYRRKIYELINKNKKLPKKKNKIIFASNEQITGLPTLSFVKEELRNFSKSKVSFYY